MKTLLAILFPCLCFSQLEIAGMTFEEDKVMHYMAGVAITSVAHDIIFEETQSKEKAILYSMATTFAIATFKEVFIDAGKGDAEDLAASIYGAITVGITIEIDSLLKKNKTK